MTILTRLTQALQPEASQPIQLACFECDKKFSQKGQFGASRYAN